MRLRKEGTAFRYAIYLRMRLINNPNSSQVVVLKTGD
jgi:hypothetical protein